MKRYLDGGALVFASLLSAMESDQPDSVLLDDQDKINWANALIDGSFIPTKRGNLGMKQLVAEAVMSEQVTGAARRLRELKATGGELYEILGGEAGANLIRDYCDGDPEIAYAAVALVYFPIAQESRANAG